MSCTIQANNSVFMFQAGFSFYYCTFFEIRCSFIITNYVIIIVVLFEFVCLCMNEQQYARPHLAPGGCSLWGRSMRTPGLCHLTRRSAAGSDWGTSIRCLQMKLAHARRNRRRHCGEPGTPTAYRSTTQFYTWKA